MGLDQTVTRNRLVAGIGFRHGTPSNAIVALIRRAIAEAGPEDRLVAIATAADRAAEPSIREAAAAFGLVPMPIERDALEQVDRRVPTRSARIERLRGVGSVAEAAALAVAGDTGHLVLARIDDGQATCALAVMGRGTALQPEILPPGRTDVAVSSHHRWPDKASASERATAAQIVTPLT